MTAAELVYQARTYAGFSQKELAAVIGSAQPAISRWENGGCSPTVATLTRLLAACGLELVLRARVTS